MKDSLRTTDKDKQPQAMGANCVPRADSFVEFRNDDVEQSIVSRFEQQVRKYPRRIAVKTETKLLTYQELDSDANRVAAALLHTLGRTREPVAMLFEHGVGMVVAILGILKADKMYVPLNRSYPVPRLKKIIEDSGTKMLITNELNRDLAVRLIAGEVRLMSTDHLDNNFNDQIPNLSITPDALAYIMYTSGSSGTPKGLVQNHRNVMHNTMTYTNGIRICTEDKLTLLHACSYGASINNLFSALLNGATLLPFDIHERGTAALHRFVVEEEVSIFHSVPAVFRNFAQELTGKEDLRRLRVIHLSGAPVSKWDLALYKKYFSGDSVFVHRLGSTEANTVFLNVLDKDCEVLGNLVPIGFPVEGKEVFLADEIGQSVGYNTVGEIVIRSSYLSPGYWRDPERTRATFLSGTSEDDKRVYYTGDLGRMRVDGRFEYVGRKDSRVKIRGHRVETSEIEVAILNSGKIKEATVVMDDSRHREGELIAYVAPFAQRAPSASELRELLRADLPSYMIPSAFVFVDRLPILPNGKVDRSALPRPGQWRHSPNRSFTGPRTPMEQIVTDIWVRALGLEGIDIKDNFFDLGGHSLLATKILAEVRERFQVEVELRALFDHPTIEALALTIAENLARQLGSDTEV